MDTTLQIWMLMLWLVRDIALLFVLRGILRVFFVSGRDQRRRLVGTWLVWGMAFIGLVVSVFYATSERSGFVFTTTNAAAILVIEAALLFSSIPLSRKLSSKQTS